MELILDRITKQYKNKIAVDRISLTMQKGIYGLLGANGAGKTTLMRMICGILRPDSGEIFYDGMHVGEEGYRNMLGYLPQEFGYYPGYTPRQFLRYVAALQCIPRKEADQRISELLELVGLSDAEHKKMRQLSGGMRQRVGIAQAMLNDPRLLILDEPTAGLDPRERVRFRNLIHSLAEDRIVILSTHIVSDIETIAGQIVMLRDHKLFCCDSPAGIRGTMKGRVFEVPAGTALEENQFLLSERQGEQGTVLRIFCDTPPQGAVPVTPSLEDAFLAVYREGQV